MIRHHSSVCRCGIADFIVFVIDIIPVISHLAILKQIRYFKGAVSPSFSVTLNSQNIYLYPQEH